MARQQWRVQVGASGTCIGLKTTVEAISECRQIARSVFCETDSRASTIQAGLEIGQYRVGPKEFRQVFGFSAADDDR